jgi:hypothetical protein
MSKLNPAHALETICSLSSIRTNPQRIFFKLKMPRKINGGGNRDIMLVRSAGAVGTPNGK